MNRIKTSVGVALCTLTLLTNIVSASDCPCSKSTPVTCVVAGTTIWSDPLCWLPNCCTEIIINNTVTGSECKADPNGYKMSTSVQPNWVSETKIVRKWVGNTKIGFCKVTFVPLNGVNYDCWDCRPCEFPAEKCSG